MRKTRHSPLTQINRGNVASSRSPGSYDTGEKGDTQTQPIVVGARAVRLHAVAQDLRARRRHRQAAVEFDSGIAGIGANRGLMYWADGEDARVFAAVDNFVYALDAATGKPIDGFGKHGRIDLRENLGRDPATQSVRLTTPGVIYRDLMIVGGRVGESLPASPGPRARLRRAHRRAALDLPHHSAARRARSRHLAEGRLAVHRRRQQLARHDAR